MDLPGLCLLGRYVPLKSIVYIDFDGEQIEFCYRGVICDNFGNDTEGVRCMRVPPTSPDYDRILKWIKNQDVSSDAIAQLKERVEQLEAKIDELEHSPMPGIKFLAAQEHYLSLRREQEPPNAKKE